MFKMATPQKFQFRMTKGWQNIWFRRTNEVHYIGGSDVLPAPLEAQEEAKMLENLEGGEHQEEARKRLIEHNLRLVVYIAKKFDNTGVGVEDLISIGTIGNELLLSDILGTDEDVIYRDMETEVEYKLLFRAIAKLSDREQTIVNLRYGLNSCDGKEKTQKEVADILGISQSYISRLEKKIMKRLKREMIRYEQ